MDDAEEWEGNDCTYFISMALKEGGLSTDKTWYRNSDAYKNRSVRSYYPTSTYSNARTLKLS